ncbi:hypothetical protein C1X38_31665 [Pseudomonas sp. GW456-12-1-14-LB2]|nr:hypothetical protein C1X38_31665 [Pseudomonas sp. GW456-12-1-14-LB2]
MPGNRDVECQTVIASRLAPTRGVESRAKAAVSPIKLWECACSRKRSARQQRCQISDRHREQARSHRGVESSAKAAVSPIKLWECACSGKRSARQQRC